MADKETTLYYEFHLDGSTFHDEAEGGAQRPVAVENRIAGPIYFRGERYETYEDYRAAKDKLTGSAVEHPSHYNEHPSGVECLDIIRHMNFNLGNVIKYVWRADLKEDAIQDLEKAVFYLKDEIQRRTHKEG